MSSGRSASDESAVAISGPRKVDRAEPRNSICEEQGDDTVVRFDLEVRECGHPSNERKTGFMERVRLSIVDRFELTCQSLKMFFESQPGLDVAWTATSSDDALRRLEVTPPQALILDCDVDDGNPFDLTRRIRTSWPACKVILLSSSNSISLVSLVLDAKAQGCLLKEDPPEVVVDGIRRAVIGETCWSPRVERHLRLDGRRESCEMIAGPVSRRLTPRQVEIVRHLAEGAKAKEVARRLHLSAKSVESHAYRIMKRLNLRDRVDLVRYAIREGLIAP